MIRYEDRSNSRSATRLKKSSNFCPEFINRYLRLYMIRLGAPAILIAFKSYPLLGAELPLLSCIQPGGARLKRQRQRWRICRLRSCRSTVRISSASISRFSLRLRCTRVIAALEGSSSAPLVRPGLLRFPPLTVARPPLLQHQATINLSSFPKAATSVRSLRAYKGN